MPGLPLGLLTAVALAGSGEALLQEHCTEGRVSEVPVAQVDGGKLYRVGCSMNMVGRTLLHTMFRWVGPDGTEVWSYGHGAMEQRVTSMTLDDGRLSWTSAGVQRYDTRTTTTEVTARWDAVPHRVVDPVVVRTWTGEPPQPPTWRTALLAEGTPSARWLALPVPHDGITSAKASLPVWDAAWSAVDALRKAGRHEEAALRALAYLPAEIDEEELTAPERAAVVERVNDLAFVASEHFPGASIDALATIVDLQGDRAVASLNLGDALWACGSVDRARQAYRHYRTLTTRPVARAATRVEGAEAPADCAIDAPSLLARQQQGVDAVDAELVVGVAYALRRELPDDPAVTEVLRRLRQQRRQPGEARLVAPHRFRGDEVPDGWPVGWDLWFADGRWRDLRPWTGLAAGLGEATDGGLVVADLASRTERAGEQVRVDRGAYTVEVTKLVETPGGWCGLSRGGGLLCQGQGRGVADAPFAAGWVDMASEGERVCAVHRDGYADCWGQGGPLHLPGVVDLWLGPEGARCLLLAAGTLDCIGVDPVPELQPYPEGLDLPAVMSTLAPYRPALPY